MDEATHIISPTVRYFSGLHIVTSRLPLPPSPVSEFNKREGCRLLSLERLLMVAYKSVSSISIPSPPRGIRILCGRNSWLFFIGEILRVEFYYVAAC